VPIWVSIVQCWIATGVPPWPARYGLLDAPGGAVWIARWRCLSRKLEASNAAAIARLTGQPSRSASDPGMY